MSRAAASSGRVLVTAVVGTLLVWRLGTGPVLRGVRAVDARALAAAAGLSVLTTVCCSWRWRLVADGLGVGISLPAAIGAYYRSLFLNVTLPGGIVGDVHRGISHGRELGDVGGALRAVAWERFAGQVVQGVVTVVVLLALPSPVRASMPVVALAVIVALVGGVLLGRTRLVHRRPLLSRRAWLAVAFASAVVVCGHAATFLIAARTAGAAAPLSRMLPLALLAMLAMVLPSAGGWGPREGVTAWVFGAAGLGAGLGVATAVAYGVMVFVAGLPGAVVLVVSSSRRVRGGSRTAMAPPEQTARA